MHINVCWHLHLHYFCSGAFTKAFLVKTKKPPIHSIQETLRMLSCYPMVLACSPEEWDCSAHGTVREDLVSALGDTVVLLMIWKLRSYSLRWISDIFWENFTLLFVYSNYRLYYYYILYVYCIGWLRKAELWTWSFWSFWCPYHANLCALQ